MSEQIPPPLKKVVSRNVAIGLGIICVILIAGLGGAMAYYVSTHSHTDSDYNSLSTQNANLTNIVNLSNSAIWVHPITLGSSSTIWTPFSANYAGYVVVSVQSSNVSGTHVEVTYSAYGTFFNQTQVTSAGTTSYTPVFPILPSSDIAIVAGNDNVFAPATQTVTITYYY
jgi:hypothetical protein